MEPSNQPVRLNNVTRASRKTETTKTPWWLMTTLLVVLAAACGTGNSGSPPTPDDGTAATDGNPPDDRPVSVADALKLAPDGPVTVQGFLFFTSEGVLLADHLLESFPPQPGGATLLVVGLEQEAYPTQTAQRVSWTEQVVEVIGTLEGQVLSVGTENL